MSELELLPVGAVDVHPHNPRKDVGDLTELAASIRSVGVLQPITVHKKGKRYVCLLGHRRLAAAKAAGLEVVPAVTWNGLSEADQVALMLVENLQREDLNPIDEADALGELASTMKQEEIAAKVGRSQSYISRRLRLLELDDEVKASVVAGKTSAAAALRTLEPKKDRPKKADEPSGDDRTLADQLHTLYGDAAPTVIEVYSLLHDALFAIDDGRLPAAAAAIGDANRRLFNLAGQEPARICARCHERPTIGGDEPESVLCEVCGGEFKALVDSAHEEAVAADPSLGEDVDDDEALVPDAEALVPDADVLLTDEPDDFEPAETLASITQLRAASDPVSQLAAGIAEAVQEGEGERAGITVTIGAPEGMFKTREVNCSTCGRLTRATELDFARSKARTHMERVHGGNGEIVEAAPAEGAL